MANFKDFTRYTGGIASRTRSGKSFLVLRPPLNLEDDEGDTVLRVPTNLIRRPDLLSAQVYGTPHLWWVIYEFNGIKDPLFEITTGTILKIPELSRVLEAIQSLEN